MAAPSAGSLNRRAKDCKDVFREPPEGISAWPKGDNLQQVEAQVVGPEGTPYAGGIFHLVVNFPDRYPMEPPNAKFLTRIYHPNISHDGNICLDVLNMPPKGSWSPASSLRTVLLSIQLLLSEPNPNDPLDDNAAKDYLSSKQLFNARAAALTRAHAQPGADAAAGSTSGGSTAAPAAAAGGLAGQERSAPEACSASGQPAPGGAIAGTAGANTAAGTATAARGPSSESVIVQGAGQPGAHHADPPPAKSTAGPPDDGAGDVGAQKRSAPAGRTSRLALTKRPKT